MFVIWCFWFIAGDFVERVTRNGILIFYIIFYKFIIFNSLFIIYDYYKN